MSFNGIEMGQRGSLTETEGRFKGRRESQSAFDTANRSFGVTHILVEGQLGSPGDRSSTPNAAVSFRCQI